MNNRELTTLSSLRIHHEKTQSSIRTYTDNSVVKKNHLSIKITELDKPKL
jgi:hypothetical protein